MVVRNTALHLVGFISIIAWHHPLRAIPSDHSYLEAQPNVRAKVFFFGCTTYFRTSSRAPRRPLVGYRPQVGLWERWAASCSRSWWTSVHPPKAHRRACGCFWQSTLLTTFWPRCSPLTLFLQIDAARFRRTPCRANRHQQPIPSAS